MYNLRTLSHQIHLNPDYFNFEVEDVVMSDISISTDRTTPFNNPEKYKVNTNRCEILISFNVLFFTNNES
jgi:hypothetical protein